MNLTITKNQLFFIIIKSQIGIGLLSLPSSTQSSAHGDAWISVLVAGGLIQLLLLVYWGLMKRFPTLTLRQMNLRMFGSYIGKALNLIYYLSFIMIAGYACTLYVRLIHNWMLPLTPGWILLLLIIAVSVYLATDNLRVIARFFILSSLLFVVLFLIGLLTFTNETHFSNIFPIGHSGAGGILQGVEKTFFSLLGFEVILYFFPQAEGSPKELLRTSSLAVTFVTLYYTYFVFICLIGFSPAALEQVSEPVLYLFKGLSYQVVDRLDMIFLTIWIIPMTSTIVSYMAVAGKSVTASQGSYRISIWITGTCVFALAGYLLTVEDLESISKWMEYTYLVMIAAIPILMWIVSFFLKKTIKEELV